MRISEARQVIAAVVAAAEDRFVTRPLVEELCKRIPDIDWKQLVVDIDPVLAPLAPVETLRDLRAAIVVVAARRALSDLRWSPSRRLVVAASATSSGYMEVMGAEEEIARLAGGGVDIVLDSAPVVDGLQDLEAL